MTHTYKELPPKVREKISRSFGKGFVCASIRKALDLFGTIGPDTPVVEGTYAPDGSGADGISDLTPFAMTLSDCVDLLEEGK